MGREAETSQKKTERGQGETEHQGHLAIFESKSGLDVTFSEEPVLTTPLAVITHMLPFSTPGLPAACYMLFVAFYFLINYDIFSFFIVLSSLRYKFHEGGRFVCFVINVLTVPRKVLGHSR